MLKNDFTNTIEVYPKEEHGLKEENIRFRCRKCGWYIDFQENFLDSFKAHYTGIDCAECGFPVIRWK